MALLLHRSFEVSPDDLLLIGPVGDILSARIAAVDLLRDVALPSGDWTLALLFLTASLLQCAISDGEAVTRRALVAYLMELSRTGLPGLAMQKSGLQFCRYAAAEVERLAPLQRMGLVQTLLASTAEPEMRQDENAGEMSLQVSLW